MANYVYVNGNMNCYIPLTLMHFKLLPVNPPFPGLNMRSV